MDNRKFFQKWSKTRKRGRLLHNITYAVSGSIGGILAGIYTIYSHNNYTSATIIAPAIGGFIGGLIGGNSNWNKNEKKYSNILNS
ncbi:hypothetical protein [Tepidibacter sp. Z1-5]|uniref:hypothetical protein n=1 Tax=Tepidibacter sp. Z1-5 TaxID=3134138 RepID=UPI0030BF14A2